MPVTDRERLTSEVTTLVGELGAGRAALLPILQEVKRRSGAIDDETMQVIADLIGIHPVEVHSVATFYALLDPSPPGAFTLRLCRTISCDLAGKEGVARVLESELGVAFGQTTDDGCFTLGWANCIGMCDQGPALLVNEQAYARVTPEIVREIAAQCRRTFAGQTKNGRDPVPAARARTQGNALTCSAIDAARGLATAPALSRPDIIDTVTASGMKGRGGAGFPTGTKWNLAGSEKAGLKYVICNADEGEPGTFKDRVILSEFPDLVFAGMTLAARAIGAAQGIVYLRGEYAYLRPALDAALEQRRAAGLLGKDAGGVRAHGTANARKVMEDIKAGGRFSKCHFIEFMACPSGCLGGGGQPIPTSPQIRAARARAIYAEDKAYDVRKSYENPAVAQIYAEFLTDGPCGHKSHALLHISYTARGKQIPQPRD